ncbi:MAG: NTP transferase domain-containing protein [Nocardioides sp.]|nr:NTP transferase domain-containing protein [Nocardioides sp.]
MTIHGLLLAAGAGRRRGGPKALARDEDGTSWLLRSLHALRPCDGVTVVIGAAAPEVARLLPPSVDVVVARDWEAGLGASLAAGLAALVGSAHDAVLVSLVDLPDVDGAVVARVLAAVAPVAADTLARATYDGRPGHPAVLGRAHWDGVAASAVGDRGARDYLAAAGESVRLVECGDLATGEDRDRV